MRNHPRLLILKSSLFVAAFLANLSIQRADETNNAPAPASPSAPAPAANPPPGYHLVWEDDFSKEPDGLPDPTKWSYEEGFVRGAELQYYTKMRKENVRIENGQLIIEARKESGFVPPPVENPDNGILPAHPGNPKNRPITYTSAAIETVHKASWKYGRIEVMAKMPTGKGVWPAIWTLGDNGEKDGWPKCGESDILEIAGKWPTVQVSTIHYFRAKSQSHFHEGAKFDIQNPTPQEDFHVYSEDWDADHITLSVDNHPVFTFSVGKADDGAYNPFRQPHYLLLNLALGGGFGGALDESVLPQRMIVKYARVYQKDP